MKRISGILFFVASLLFIVQATATVTTVTSNADTGTGSLREALTSAASGDTINFNLPAGSLTIALTTPLPIMPDGVIMDGTSQPGVTISGTSAFNGITLGSSSTLKNITVNNAATGIRLSANGNTVSNVFVGTDSTGVTAAANNVGITIQGNTNTIEDATVAGNTTDGIFVIGTGNTIMHNSIGLNVQGQPLANGGNGVVLNTNTTGNTITSNMISQNALNGIVARTASNNNIFNNSIENNSQSGIALLFKSSSNTIGGSGESNTVTGNKGAGVQVGNTPQDPSINNRVSQNDLSGNTGLGIDLGNDGITPNHPSNPVPNTPNNFQNFPVLASASYCTVPNQLTVGYSLSNTVPSTAFTIEFYKNSTNRNPGITEGGTFLGSVVVTTDASGNTGTQTAQFGPTVPLVSTDFVSATATNNATGDTSEFSFNIAAQVTTLSVTITGPTSLCAGTTLTLTAVAPNAQTFSWVTPSGNFTTSTITVNNAQPSDSGNYTVTVTADGCTATAGQTVTVNPLPQQPTLTANPTAVCEFNPVTLTALPIGSTTYEFFSNGQSIVSQSSNVYVDRPTVNPTSYTVIVTNASGCQSTSDAVQVTVTPAPIPTLSVSSTNVCTGGMVTLTAVPTGLVSYQFFANDVAISPVQTSNVFKFTPTTTMNYTVEITAANGCTVTSNPPITINSGPCALLVLDNCCNKTIFSCGTVSLTVSVTNVGAAPATNVIVTDVVPACFKVQSAQGTGWKITQSGQAIVASMASLAVGQKATFTIVSQTNCPPGHDVTSTATVVSDTTPAQSSSVTISVVSNTSPQ